MMEPSGREKHDGTNIHAYDGNNLMRVCRRYLNLRRMMITLKGEDGGCASAQEAEEGDRGRR
jgi:hypothetical protein